MRRHRVPGKFATPKAASRAVDCLRELAGAAAVVALVISATAFGASPSTVCDAVEAPAGAERDLTTPQESSDSNKSDETETAPKHERNGKGSRRIRGSDQYADRRVMNA